MIKNKGITLISLVITIIVLLILATVSINITIGENGIINKTKIAKKMTEQSKEEEIVQLAVTGIKDYAGSNSINENELRNEINRLSGTENVEIQKVGEEYEVYFSNTNRYYEIDKNGNVSEGQEFILDSVPKDITKDINGNALAGTEQEPYQVNCVEDLLSLNENLNSIGDSDSTKVIKLMRNLNFMSERSYVDPNAKYSYNSETMKYEIDEINGTSIKTLYTEGPGFIPMSLQYNYNVIFDGNSNSIKNIYINTELQTGRESFGLFDNIDIGTVKNINVTGNFDVGENARYVGSIVGYVNNSDIPSRIENVKSDIKMNGEIKYAFGGIAGIMYGYIENCQYNGNINIKKQAKDNSSEMIGGIAGFVSPRFYEQGDGSIKNCINNANINVKINGIANYSRYSSLDCGGIIGYNNGLLIENCITNGNLNISVSNKPINIGGIVGYNDTYRGQFYCQSIQRRCTNNMNIKIEGNQTNANIGGICGYSESGSLIEESNNTGKIEVPETGVINKGDICGYTEP